jgi:hypothetical protein
VQLSRRAVLGIAVLAVAGCGKHPKPAARAHLSVPDADALLTARNGERALLASYDAKIAHATKRQLPRLQVARAIHATHLDALHGTAAGTADIAVVTHLRQALRASAKQLRSLALAATNGTDAALLASIAASHQASAT